ncbi:MAG: isoprenylcysteine carboxylmethyltransferase family protein [Verrucomicrobiota bacterium]|nr:isoprenylcysteine carboxylmethyltransferase family protein [Verrucomicrobiota bacterium]
MPVEIFVRKIKQKIFDDRIFLTRILAFGLIIFLLLSGSYWRTQSEIIQIIFLSFGIILSGVGAIGRIWCSVYIAGYKNKILVVEGPYSMTRNPLYFFSLVGGIGFGLFTMTLTAPVFIIIAFALYYPSVIKKEEERLESIYGDSFRSYKQKVPSFFPNFKIYSDPESFTVNARALQSQIPSSFSFILALPGILAIHGFQYLGWVKVFWTVY